MKYLLLALVLIAGCRPESDIDASKDARYVRMPMGVSDISIVTLQHEGHRYVVVQNVNGVAMVVHPDDGKVEKMDAKSLGN